MPRPATKNPYRLSVPMLQALLSARDRGRATVHLKGRSEWGGWERTREALQRRGMLDAECGLTELGIDAIKLIPKGTR